MAVNPLTTILGAVFRPAAELIDSLHTSDAEKLAAKAGLLTIQADLTTKMLAYEQNLASEQASVIRAEAGAGWLTSNWRPLTMIVFVGLITAHWFGFSAPNMTEAAILSVFQLIKIGLGGYVVGRSAEKIVPTALAAMQARQEV